jgi:hypothetical protein
VRESDKCGHKTSEHEQKVKENKVKICHPRHDGQSAMVVLCVRLLAAGSILFLSSFFQQGSQHNTSLPLYQASVTIVQIDVADLLPLVKQRERTWDNEQMKTADGIKEGAFGPPPHGDSL